MATSICNGRERDVMRSTSSSQIGAGVSDVDLTDLIEREGMTPIFRDLDFQASG